MNHQNAIDNLYLSTINHGDLYRTYTLPYLKQFAKQKDLSIPAFRHIMGLLVNKVAKELGKNEQVTWYVRYPFHVRQASLELVAEYYLDHLKTFTKEG